MDGTAEPQFPGPALHLTLRQIFSVESRRQCYLDVEAALALTEAELGIIPAQAGERIASAARLDGLDVARIDVEHARTGHMMVPIIAELARRVGEPDGGWVHWGATTQNIQQSGDVLAIRAAHTILTGRLVTLVDGLAELGEQTADVVMPGRTHGQQAVPITFGFKVAAWSDVLVRHLQRFDTLTTRLFTSMMGGAAGTFATFGELGPGVQAGVARRLGLTPMTVSNRSIVDHFAELVCVLGMLAATSASMAEEISRLMGTELGEVSEPIPPDDVGSSTMPQKRNAKLSGTVVTLGAQVRALVPLSLEAMIQSHEVDGARSAMMDHAVTQACVLTGEILTLLDKIIMGLVLHPSRMRANLDLTRGLISAEAVMMQLANVTGRQRAHEIVHHAARSAATSGGSISFLDALNAEPLLAEQLDQTQLRGLIEPTSNTGLSATVARDASRRAREATARFHAQP